MTDHEIIVLFAFTLHIASDAGPHADGTLNLLGALTEPQGGMS